MPLLIDPIDRIAREKQRDVLFITFDYFGDYFDYENPDEIFPTIDYKTWPIRKEVIEWLDKNDIGYRLCSLTYTSGYMGELYIDVPFEKDDEQYRLLCSYLEDELGQPKIKGVMFKYLTLELAQKNAYQDAENYDPWDNI